MINSLRGRLTLWYLAAFSLVLIVFSVGVFFLVNRILYERLDTNLRSTLRIASASLSSYKASSSSFPAQVLEDPKLPNQVVLLLDQTGQILTKKPAASSVPIRLPQPFRPSDSPQLYQLPETTSESDDGCSGVYQRVLNASNGTYYSLVVIASDELISDQLDALQNVLVVAVLVALLVAGSGGWFLAKRGLAPLETMATLTERITVSNLTERVPVQNPDDELGRLARRFNDLLSRLDQTFGQQRQFMADASHELRTPLSAIRTAAQVTLQKNDRAEHDYREALVLVEKQTARLSRLVDDMFALTRADMGQLPLERTELHLEDIVLEVVATLKVLANQKGVMLQSETLEEAKYHGDENLLRRMISNLADNAIKYTPSGGRVTISLKQKDEFYEIAVTDTGPGIAPELQPHIFERFFRADKARCNGDNFDGAGLGLSIARSIAHLHGGVITLMESTSKGSTFAVILPVRNVTPARSPAQKETL